MNKQDTEQFVKQTIWLYEIIRKAKLISWTTWDSEQIYWIVFPNHIMYEDFFKFIDEPHDELNIIGEKYQEIAFIRLAWEEN